MKPNPRVLIVGAGPTGLSLACDLTRRGVPVRVIDALAAPTRHSKGKGLQPRTLEIFDDLGLIEEAVANGCPYPRFRVHAGRFSMPAGGIDKLRIATSDVPYPNLWMLPQWRTEELLRQQLQQLGGEVEQGVRLVEFRQEVSGVNAQLDVRGAREDIRVEYLVGCDGGHSTVRKSLPINFTGEALPGERVVVADVELSGLDRAAWHVWPLARGCTLTLCPLPGTSIFQLAAPLSAKSNAPELTQAGLRHFVAAATGGRVRVESVSWASMFRPQVRMVDRYRVERVFLAGDAAHVHPPAGGQGLNTGVQDAYNLGWKLAAVLGGAPNFLLDSYELERLPVAAAMLGLSKRLHVKRSARRGSETKQLGVGYRDGPLALPDFTGTGKLQAGDRAPDAHGAGSTGTPQRLFDVFRGPHFTLLNFGARAPIPASETLLWSTAVRHVLVAPERRVAQTGDWVDTEQHARTTYGIQAEGAVLVRPDGYLAAVSTGPASNLVTRYLDLHQSGSHQPG